MQLNTSEAVVNKLVTVNYLVKRHIRTKVDGFYHHTYALQENRIAAASYHTCYSVASEYQLLTNMTADKAGCTENNDFHLLICSICNNHFAGFNIASFPFHSIYLNRISESLFVISCSIEKPLLSSPYSFFTYFRVFLHGNSAI